MHSPALLHNMLVLQEKLEINPQCVEIFFL